MYRKIFKYFRVIAFLICMLLNNNSSAVAGFGGNTFVLLGTGKYKEIKDVVEGEIVACFSLKERRIIYDVVKQVKQEPKSTNLFGVDQYVDISYQDEQGSHGQICAGYDTLFLCTESGTLKMVKAKDLSVNTVAGWPAVKVFSADKNETANDENPYFYRLILKTHQLYFITKSDILAITQ